MAMIRLTGNGKTFITLGSLDQDWVYTDDFPDYSKGIRVHSIQFVPSAWNDVCAIKDHNGSSLISPVVFNAASLNRFETKYFHGAIMKPFYDISADGNVCTASANAKIIIHLGGYSL